MYNLDDEVYEGIVHVDFAKAFDKVRHKRHKEKRKQEQKNSYRISTAKNEHFTVMMQLLHLQWQKLVSNFFQQTFS